MSRKRKTVEVEKIREEVNRLLALESLNMSGKEALAHMLEGILFDTGNYKGFKWLNPDNGIAIVDNSRHGTRGLAKRTIAERHYF